MRQILLTETNMQATTEVLLFVNMALVLGNQGAQQPIAARVSRPLSTVYMYV